MRIEVVCLMAKRYALFLIGVSVSCWVQASGAAIPPPDAYMETLLGTGADHISDADREAIRAIVHDVMTNSRTTTLYTEATDAVTVEINRILGNTIEHFPSGESYTELQRDATLASLRLDLANAIVSPTFEGQESPEVDAQIGVLADALSQAAIAIYPDLRGTAIESHIRNHFEDVLLWQSQNELSAAFKVPLPESELQELLDEIALSAEGAMAFGVFDNGHISPDWDSLSAAERTSLLEEQSQFLVHYARMSLTEIELIIGVRSDSYGRAAYKDSAKAAADFPIDAAELEKLNKTIRAARAEGQALSEASVARSMKRLKDRSRLAQSNLVMNLANRLEPPRPASTPSDKEAAQPAEVAAYSGSWPGPQNESGAPPEFPASPPHKFPFAMTILFAGAAAIVGGLLARRLRNLVQEANKGRVE